MRDMDALGPQFARGALRQPAQGELALAKAAECGYPLALALAPVSRIAPWPFGIMRRAASRTVRYPPKAEISIALRTASGSSSAIGPCARALALNSTTSGSPSRSSAAAKSCATASGCEASTAKVWAPISSASGASFSTLRAASPTLSPALATARAKAALIPEPAPTTRPSIQALAARATANFSGRRAHLKTLLGFIGISDVQFIHAEGLDIGPESRANGLAQAKSMIDQALGGRVGQLV